MLRKSMVLVGIMAAFFLGSTVATAGGDAGPRTVKSKKAKAKKPAPAAEATVATNNAVRVKSAPPLVQYSYCPSGDLLQISTCTRVEGIKYLAPNEMARLEPVWAVYTTNAVVTSAPLVYVPMRNP